MLRRFGVRSKKGNANAIVVTLVGKDIASAGTAETLRSRHHLHNGQGVSQHFISVRECARP